MYHQILFNFCEKDRLFPTPFLSLLPLLIITTLILPIASGDSKLQATNFEATKSLAGVIQIEAEILELTTYLVENSPAASGGKLICLPNSAGSNGVGSSVFRGSEGEYFITVN